MVDAIIIKKSQERTWLSMIIPAKAEDDYLPRTLARLDHARTVLGLDFHIVVVLAPPSSAMSLCMQLADTVLIEPPEGVRSIAEARNIGARHCSSELMFHTDADVELDDPIALLAAIRQVFSDGSVAGLTTRINPRDPTATDKIAHWLGNTLIRLSYRVGVPFARGECQVVRSEFFEAVGGYRPEIIVGEDWDLFRRLRGIGRLCFLSGHSVTHSTRRFRYCGYGRVAVQYAKEGISLAIRDRSWASEWPPIR